MELCTQGAVVEFQDPAHVVAVQKIEREVALLALLVVVGQIEHDFLVEVRTDHPIPGDRDHRLVHTILIAEGGLHMHQIPAVEELAATVLGRDDTVPTQRLGQRRQSLLTVEQEKLCGRPGCEIHAFEGTRLEANLTVTGLEQHHCPERMTAQHGHRS